MCVQTCYTKNDQTFICPSGEACKPGCQCKSGFVEDTNGNCVPEEDCACFDQASKIWRKLTDTWERKKTTCAATEKCSCTKDRIKCSISCGDLKCVDVSAN